MNKEILQPVPNVARSEHDDAIDLRYAKTWALWLVFTVFICTLVALQHASRSVVHSYWDGALNWINGQALYNHEGRGFIYLPQSAILFSPFALLPKIMAEILWRLLSIVLLAFAVRRFCTLFENTHKHIPYFTLLSIITIPIAFSSARNGQMNLMLTALMLFAFSALHRRRYWLSAILLALGFAFKPTAIVWLLLAFGLFKPLRLRLALCCLALFLLPFLTQTAHYVVTEYQASLMMLHAASQVGTTQAAHWAQLFGLLETLGLPKLPDFLQQFIRILAAAATLWFCYLAKKNNTRTTALVVMYSFAATYLMLFNPRTENNDYVILAPAIGYYLAQSYHFKQWIHVLLLGLITIGILGSYPISHHLTPGHVSWITPLSAVIFLGLVLQRLFAARASTKKPIPAGAPP